MGLMAKKEPSVDSGYDTLTNEEKNALDKVTKLVNDICNEDKVNIIHLAQFWSYFATSLYKSRPHYMSNLEELENQKKDLEHFLSDKEPTSEEYSDILRKIGITVSKRRVAKDLLSFISVAHENINKISGFIYNSMNRKYTPRSVKYGEGKTYVKIDHDLDEKLKKVNGGR